MPFNSSSPATKQSYQTAKIACRSYHSSKLLSRTLACLSLKSLAHAHCQRMHAFLSRLSFTLQAVLKRHHPGSSGFYLYYFQLQHCNIRKAMSNNQSHIYINQDDDLIITVLPGLAASATSFVSASSSSQDNSSTTINLFLEIFLHSFLPEKINISSQISFLPSLLCQLEQNIFNFTFMQELYQSHLI